MSPGWLVSPTRLSPRGSVGLMRLLRTPVGHSPEGSRRVICRRACACKPPPPTASPRLALRLGHAMMQNPKPGQGSGPAAHGTRTSLSRKPPPGSPYSAPTADPGAGTRGPTTWHTDMERLTMHRVQEGPGGRVGETNRDGETGAGGRGAETSPETNRRQEATISVRERGSQARPLPALQTLVFFLGCVAASSGQQCSPTPREACERALQFAWWQV